MGSRMRESIRQVWRDHTRYEKRQPDESKGVQQKHRSKRVSAWSAPKRGPDISCADHPPHHEAQENTDPEHHLRLYHRLGADEAAG
jgi:hypothetical protein